MTKESKPETISSFNNFQMRKRQEISLKIKDGLMLQIEVIADALI
jgi:hypothetical protein